jgi:hypothetical protein
MPTWRLCRTPTSSPNTTGPVPSTLSEQVPISELCDKHGHQPTVFYRWQKEFFGSSRTERLPFSRNRGPTIPPSCQTKDVLPAGLHEIHVTYRPTSKTRHLKTRT